MFILNIRRPRPTLGEAKGIIVAAHTKDELRTELRNLNIYSEEELEMAVELAREVGKL